METEHAVHVGDARELALPEGSVELVVTSPPYPMIEMWDDLFRRLDPAVGAALDAGDGDRAFRSMHDALDPVWDRIAEALAPGGIVCVNVGDATRSVEEFALYPNHVEIARRLRDRGLTQLPGIQWRKPVNRATKFMGSGMLPPNAYPTLEHEHVLVFRAGGPRSLEPGADRRYEAAYFWEERNEWFSDLWEFGGADQRQGSRFGSGAGEGADRGGHPGDAARERSGAYPLALPARLIRMFTAYGDRVFDPFWGTGTTTLAAMLAARDSVGCEIDGALVEAFEDRIAGLPERSREQSRARLERHAAFADERDDLAYEAEHYDFGVMTKQERRIRLYAVEEVEKGESDARADGDGMNEGDFDRTRWRCEHAPVEF
ncbi:modification methylase [Halobacteriales archaeon QS_5_70_17]|nr:MAG: modification methylase [Halobacteriales archaeon QS_5_70_17]